MAEHGSAPQPGAAARLFRNVQLIARDAGHERPRHTRHSSCALARAGLGNQFLSPVRAMCDMCAHMLRCDTGKKQKLIGKKVDTFLSRIRTEV